MQMPATNNMYVCVCVCQPVGVCVGGVSRQG